MKEPLLDVHNLKKHYPVRNGLFTRGKAVKAVDGVSFSLGRGEALGLVGESGCGKTTTARGLLRAVEPSGGEVWFNPSDPDRPAYDVLKLEKRQLNKFRREAQMVFQDPYASLNPRLTVEESIAEPLVCLNEGTASERRARVSRLLDLVGLPENFRTRYPHAFSGGQRQRICIARALALEPKLLVCDEAVSALDVSVQAQILNLLIDLQTDLGLSLLFVSHDLGVVEHLCDRVAVMYAGKIVELAETRLLYKAPKHPYTAALLSAVPNPDSARKVERLVIEGEVADPAERPAGCSFHPRCPFAQAICTSEDPPLTSVGGTTHKVACHFADTLNLSGVL